MRTRTFVTTLLALLSALPAHAQSSAQPANEQVVVPEVARRDIKLPRFPSKDWSIALFGGSWSTQNFGSSAVGGIKLGYHLSEDFFVEAAVGATQVSDDSFRQILPGGVFVDDKERLSYYNLSVGYNLLPGEVFLGSKRALATAFYLIGGVGSTRFVDQRRQTVNVGFGWRVLAFDRAAIQLDVRDHVFSIDLLGRRETTQNVELTAGLAYYF